MNNINKIRPDSYLKMNSYSKLQSVTKIIRGMQHLFYKEKL